MKPNFQNPLPPQEPTHPGGWRRRVLLLAGGLLLIYFITAYLILPMFWRAHTKRHPGLSDGPRLTQTANHIPGDPVNIAVDSVFHRPDDDAPVSDLFLFGRKQDLAFEQPVGGSPRQRHHVRFWRWDKLEDGRPVWFGSATYDERVGLSRETGQITHHIGPDVDAERDRIVADLQKAGQAQETDYIDHFHQQLEGKNGGGDPWRTDGRLAVTILVTHTNTPAAATIKQATP